MSRLQTRLALATVGFLVPIVGGLWLGFAFSFSGPVWWSDIATWSLVFAPFTAVIAAAYPLEDDR